MLHKNLPIPVKEKVVLVMFCNFFTNPASYKNENSVHLELAKLAALRKPEENSKSCRSGINCIRS